MAQPSQKRSRSGCLTCRSRRIKCDEMHPECVNCRGRYSCNWPDIRNVTDKPRRPSQLDKNREARYSANRLSVCTSCRRAKRSCDRLFPECTRCVEKDLRCDYSVCSAGRNKDIISKLSTSIGDPVPEEDIHWSGEASIPKDDHPSHLRFDSALHSGTTEGLTRNHDISLLLDAFFSHVYPLPGMSFLHRTTLEADILHGTASQILLRAIGAVSFRFLEAASKQHPDGGAVAFEWASEVKHQLMDDTDRYELSKVAATLCIVLHEANSGRIGSSWLLVPLASRMAFAMSLNVKADHSSWVEGETKRRLMWAVFCADAKASGGFKEYLSCVPEAISCDLPSEEHNFVFGIPPAGPQTPTTPEMNDSPLIHPSNQNDGLMAWWIRLLYIRTRMLGYMKHFVQHDKKPWEDGSNFIELASELNAYRAQIPTHLTFNAQNLSARKLTQEMGSLFMLHAALDQVYVGLHRIALPGFEESAPAPYFADAPTDWINATRLTSFQYACAVREKIRFMSIHFPGFTPDTRHIDEIIYISLRVQLQYWALYRPLGLDQAEHHDILEGMQCIVDLVGRMCRWFSEEKRPLRDVIQLLYRHGFMVKKPVPDSLSCEGSTTPARGPVLRKLYWLRRYFRNPEITVAARSTRESRFDSATQAHLTNTSTHVQDGHRDISSRSCVSSEAMTSGTCPLELQLGSPDDDCGLPTDPSQLDGDFTALQEALSFSPLQNDWPWSDPASFTFQDWTVTTEADEPWYSFLNDDPTQYA